MPKELEEISSVCGPIKWDSFDHSITLFLYLGILIPIDSLWDKINKKLTILFRWSIVCDIAHQGLSHMIRTQTGLVGNTMNMYLQPQVYFHIFCMTLFSCIF